MTRPCGFCNTNFVSVFESSIDWFQKQRICLLNCAYGILDIYFSDNQKFNQIQISAMWSQVTWQKCYLILILKPSQNKKGQKKFQLHHFLNTFLQLALGSWEKVFKKRCSWKFFWPFLFCDGFSKARKLPIPLSKESCVSYLDAKIFINNKVKFYLYWHQFYPSC